MPIVAEPQPTRIRSSTTPLITGGWPACRSNSDPSSTVSSAGSPLQSARSVSMVATPSRLEPPVRWFTPPSESICDPYWPVVTWPTASPRARTSCRSAPTWRSVSIFTSTPQ